MDNSPKSTNQAATRLACQAELATPVAASYGKYQFFSTYGVADAFVRWLCAYHKPELANYSKVLRDSGSVNSDTFITKWREIGTIDPGNFGELQREYTQSKYYDIAVRNLFNWYNFDISVRSIALKNVLWSNAVQHGPHYGAEIFRDAALSSKKALLEMNDYELIYHIYEIKLTDKSWSSGSPTQRPSLFNRWCNELNEALSMLQE